VLFLLVNTLIGGMTGSGKSGVVNVIIRALARMPQVAVLGIDMKPGAPELGKWRKVMHALATDAEGACDLLDKLREGLEYRGSVMSELGIRTWRPTRDQPFIVLIVDELQELKAARLGTKFDRIVAIIRAYGGCVIGATQYPTRNNVSPTVKENCPQKIGLLTEGATADRVIFGESATKDRWSPSSIPPDRQGSFFVRSPEYKRPMLARAYFVDDDAVDHDAELLAPMRTLIDVGTWPAIDRPHRPRDEIGAGGGQRADDAETETEADGDDGGVCDAILIDDDPLELVLQMLGKPTGDGKDGWRPVDIGAALDLSRATVYRRLAQLAEKGLASSIEKGRWVKT
jgi:S-DNA-T family DNA segregation ATPase FtsK/SpoIIIE